MATTLVTLNCFDSPLSLSRHSRLNLLAAKIISLKPDLIFFQEITFTKTAAQFASLFREHGYKVYYDAGFILNKGGLFTASLLPLGPSRFVRFKNQGKFLSLQFTDKILGKGYQQLQLSLGGKDVTLFNVHLANVYNHNSPGEQKILQNQLKQLTQSLTEVKNAIVCGDFNFSPASPLYTTLLETTNLIDPLSHSNLVTVSSGNTHRQGPLKQGTGQKLDYTLISKGLFQKVVSQVIFSQLFQVNNQNIHLSDHFGLLVTLET